MYMRNIMGKYTLRNRFALLALGIFSMILMGNIGYIVVKTWEGGNPTILEAMYWTVVTLSTLGSYPSGMTFQSDYGMVLTIFIVLGGVLTIFIGLQIVVGPWIENTMKRALKKKKEPIPSGGHVIVCGFSGLGNEVIRNLEEHGVDHVVITDKEEELEKLLKKKIPFVKGDSTETKTLKKANVRSANTVVAVSDDSTNAFICLTTHKIDPDIRIVSSVDRSKNKGILRRAGADHVISSKSITGAMIGTKAIEDSVIEMDEDSEKLLGGLKIEQIKIDKDSRLADRSIKEAKIGTKTGAAVVGIWKGGNLKVSISPKDELKPGDTVLALGDVEQLKSLKRYA